MGISPLPGSAQKGFRVGRRVGNEAVPEHRHRILETHPAGKFLQVVPGDDQAARLAVHMA